MLINDHFQNFKVYQIPRAQKLIEKYAIRKKEIETIGFSKTEINEDHPTLF
jgi:hypothetical protein